jgi:acetolactate synthase I/II/III large subunit
MYKPIIIIGNGCRNNPTLVEHLCSLGIPVLVTWQGIDLVPEDCPTYCGRPGVFGQRAANIIQQKADAVFIFGARMDGEQTAYDFNTFAPHAEKYVYDVDAAELDKFPTSWGRIYGDLTKVIVDIPGDIDPDWLAWSRGLYDALRPELDADALDPDYIGTKEFLSALNAVTREDDLLAVASSSGAVNTFMQTWKVKRGQRITVCASIGAMGADIPMAIGGAIATGKRTICITGDGGFQLNSNELEVVRRLGLNIKFFVFSNNGYNSIRAMQDVRFSGRHVGADPASGFTIPAIRSLASCYGISYLKAEQYSYPRMMRHYLVNENPTIVEVPVNPAWVQWPKVASSLRGVVYTTDPMEDMTPHLDPAELAEIMAWGK